MQKRTVFKTRMLYVVLFRDLLILCLYLTKKKSAQFFKKKKIVRDTRFVSRPYFIPSPRLKPYPHSP